MSSELTINWDDPGAVLKALDEGWPWPLDSVQEWFEALWNNIYDWVYSRTKDAIESVLGWTSWVWDRLRDIVADVVGAAQIVGSWVSDKVLAGLSWLGDTFIGMWSTAYGWLASIWQAVSTGIVDLAGTIGGTIGGFFQGLWDGLTEWFTNLWRYIGHLGDFIEDISEWANRQFQAVFARIDDMAIEGIGDLPNLVINAIKTLIDEFLSTIRPPPRTNPEPRPEEERNWWDNVLEGFIWVWRISSGGMIQTWVEAIRYFQTGVVGSELQARIDVLGWIGDKVEDVVDAWMDSVEGWLHNVGSINPEQGTSPSRQLLKMASIGAGGLGAMTVGGELLHPLKEIGLGHVAAMIGDLTNYRTISALFMTAVLTGVIRTPLNYYVNSLVRPWIIDRRDFTTLMGRNAFVSPETLQTPELIQSMRELTGGDGISYEKRTLGYYGYPDVYHGLFKELSYTRLGYFALAGIAREGFFDEAWYREALARTGYSPTAIDALLGMYRSLVQEQTKGTQLPLIKKRFREGFIDEAGFRAEAEAFGWSPEQIEPNLMAAKLDYQTDYYTDLLFAFRDAFTRDIISEDEFRQQLSSLGMVSDRIEAYLYREMIKKVPRPRPPKIAPEKPLYQRPEGKKWRDEAITLFRAEEITETQFYERLINLEMPNELADATVDLEVARKWARVKPKTPEILPFYETDEGKVRVRTLRILYRGELLTDPEYLQGLRDLEVPPSLADAMLEQERARRIAAGPPLEDIIPPLYKTDAGKIDLRTARSSFYKALTTEEELKRRLGELELPPDLARAIVDYEKVRKVS